MGGAAPKIVVPVDTSTSTVIKPGTEPQIQCGRVAVETQRDITYSGELKMDVLTPSTPGAKPLVVYLPGGGFMSSAKEMSLNTRTFVAEAGYVVASIQYGTLSTGATYTDTLDDIKAAIEFLRTNAAEYSIDPAKVAVWGDSAGGYLASMTGLATDAGVQAVVDDFGASDLSKVTADFDPAGQQAMAALTSNFGKYVGGSDPAAFAKADPATLAKADSPAFLIFHGNQDALISPSQTLVLHNALKAAGADSTRYIVDGAGHGELSPTPESKLPWSTQQVMGLVVDFLKAQLS
jgi:acetyl esterase/lipase